MNKAFVGSTLESLFDELGEGEEFRQLARKKIIAEQLRQAMKRRKITPTEMARHMGTSRPAVYRLLDPSNRGVTLDSLDRASSVLGYDLDVRLIARKQRVAGHRRRRAA